MHQLRLAPFGSENLSGADLNSRHYPEDSGRSYAVGAASSTSSAVRSPEEPVQEPALHERLRALLHIQNTRVAATRRDIAFEAVARPSSVREVVLTSKGARSSAHEILLTQAIFSSFRCSEGGLTSITVYFRNINRRCRASAEVKISGPTGVIAKKTVRATSVVETVPITVSFPPQLDSAGARYQISISSDDGVIGESLSVMGDVSIANSELSAELIAPLDSVIERVTACAQSTVDTPDEILVPVYKVFSVPSYSADLKTSSKPRFAGVTQGWECRAQPMLPVTLHSQGVIGARFLNELQSIQELHLLTATYMRVNDCAIELRLYEEDENASCIIHSQLYTAQGVRDNEYTVFPFSPIALQVGKYYRFELRSPDATPGNCIAVYTNPLPLNSQICQKRTSRGKFSAVNVAKKEGFIERSVFLTEDLPARRPGDLTERRKRISALENLKIGLVLSSRDHFTGRWKSHPLNQSLLRERAELEIFTSDRLVEQWTSLELCDVVIFSDQLLFDPSHSGQALSSAQEELKEITRQTLRFLRFLGIPTIGYRAIRRDDTAFYELRAQADAESVHRAAQVVEREERLLRNLADWFDYALTDSAVSLGSQYSKSRSAANGFQLLDPVTHFDRDKLERFLFDCCSQYLDRHFPKVSIVGVLYKKAEEIPHFLDSVRRQSYAGEIELVLVDDASPGNDCEVLERYRSENPEFQITVRVIRNSHNLGNCLSRNLGVEHADGALVAVVDVDCLLNRDFIESHVTQFAWDQCDVSMGFCNLETGGENPQDSLAAYESEPERVAHEAELQDRTTRESFLNCVTRSIVVRRELLLREPFDPLFAYTSSSESGYGWEDVELGTRLYKLGARFKFAARAFSVHMSHHSIAEERTKPARSMRNFRRLLDKHPELEWLARPWVSETIRKILEWNEQVGAEPGVDGTYLAQKFRNLYHVQPKRQVSRRLKILSYRWHCGHQYELLALPHDFSYVIFPESRYVNSWEYEERPLRDNARFVPFEAVDQRDYDLALLHFDENALSAANANDVIPWHWCEPFRLLRTVSEIPIVAICHGTPSFVGQHDPEYDRPDLGQTIEEERQKLVEYTRDMTIVLNSYQAQAEWGFESSRVIWHGFDPAEYGPSRYRKQILTLGPAMRTRPHYRGYEIFKDVAGALPDLRFDGPRVRHPDVGYLPGTDPYAASKFLNYREMIRDYSVYFNPTIRSPMPRSRDEAMMSGLVPVSLRNHDVDLFIRNGWNGFYGDTSAELSEALRYLFAKPDRVRKFGERARQTASDLFNRDRYLAQWQELLVDLVGS